jgi:hypothetical protein
MKKVISVSLDEGLLKLIDAARKDVARSKFVERALDRVAREDDLATMTRMEAQLRETEPVHFTPNLAPEAQDDEKRPYICPRSDCTWPGAYTPTARCAIHGRRVVGRSKGSGGSER